MRENVHKLMHEYQPLFRQLQDVFRVHCRVFWAGISVAGLQCLQGSGFRK